ncbi:2-dehydropantoate 2-reductase [Streptomyces sp. NPDC058662]|uniref:2-dehydropantoate 2-reductase n=1 Tax=Streptomyces sp. NPDC058662 TaxID=3346583 RepID=UPI00365E45DB
MRTDALLNNGGSAIKAAVIGAGGIGGYFGARLAAAGHEVHFVARGANLAALQEHGLTVEGPEGAFSLPDVSATADTSSIGPVDLVLLAVKTWQLDAALPLLAPLVGPGSGTAVLTLQNGVTAPGETAAAVGRDAVLPGIAKVITLLDGPGRVRHVGGEGSLTFGEWDNRDSERVRRLQSVFTQAGVPATVPADIWAQLWAKFLFVVPFGGLGAAADATFGELRTSPGTRQLLVDGMTEVLRVAEGHGIALPAGIVEDTLAFIDRQPAGGTSSLHRDIAAGRPSEIDAWTGAVVRLAAQADVPAPLHGLLHQLLAPREARARGKG